ncbi:MAG TPA: glycosyltransferase family A protein [Candidatus Babeliaceae bacterium]|nr:glycosyltransferase family A protein [Candidatus Babeliaceae bacterium]
MKFTVIIPCYQQAEYLAEAIESALQQTMPAEIIVINDGSTDNTNDIAKRYPVTLISQVNKGLAAARNTGIMNAHGEYILPLDADDILEPTCIEELERETTDIIAPEFTVFGTQKGVFRYGEIPTLAQFKEANRLPYFCAIKKDALLETGGYQPKMTWGWEDYHLWFDLLSRGKTIALVRQPLVRYRTKPRSMIHEANEHSQELWAQLKKDYATLFSQN